MLSDSQPGRAGRGRPSRTWRSAYPDDCASARRRTIERLIATPPVTRAVLGRAARRLGRADRPAADARPSRPARSRAWSTSRPTFAIARPRRTRPSTSTRTARRRGSRSSPARCRSTCASSPTPHVAHPGCFATAILLASVPLLALGLVEPRPVRQRRHRQHRLGPQARPRARIIRCATATCTPTARSRIGTRRRSPPARSGRSGVEARVRLRAALGSVRARHPRHGAGAAQAARSTRAGLHRRAARLLRRLALRARQRDAPPRVKDVVGSNYAHLSAVGDGQHASRCMCVVDNLNKGAAGGAVQWMNRLLGLAETAGLTAPARRAGPERPHDTPQLDAERPPTTSRPCSRSTRSRSLHADGVWLHASDGRARARPLRRARGRGAGLRPSGLDCARSTQQARQLQLPEQRGADGRARRAPRRGWCASRACGFESVFFVNSGAEANENALKLALQRDRPQRGGRARAQLPRPHRRRRRASPGAPREKWYGFPRTPFDVSFMPRARRRRDRRARDRRDTAAVIVEPVQGVGGAFDLGARVSCRRCAGAATRSARC